MAAISQMMLIACVGSASGSDALGMSFVTSATASVGASSKTFTAVSIGAASSTRLVVITISMGLVSLSSTISSVMIGGISATQASYIENTGAAFAASIWYAAVPTGSTADIVINTSSNMGSVLIATYRLAGLSSNTPTNTNAAQATQSTALSCNTNVSAGGFLIAASVLGLGSTATFTGTSQDAVAAPAGHYYASSFTEGGAPETPRTVQITPASTDRIAIATASWR